MFFSIFLAVLLVVLVLVYKRAFKEPSTKSSLPLPPRVRWGSILKRGDKAPLLDRLSQEYGKVFRIDVPFWTSFVIITSPEYSKTYLNAKEFSLTHGYRLFNRIASPKEVTYCERDISQEITNAFSKERYTYFAKRMLVEIENCFATWHQKEQIVDWFAAAERLTFTVVLRSFVGPDLQGDLFDEYLSLVQKLDVANRILNFNLLISNFFPSTRRQMEKDWNRVKEIIKYLAEKRVKDNSQETDFFNYIVKRYTNASGEMDIVSMSVIVFSMVFAATTNTFATTAWIVLFTLQNKETRDKVMVEQREYLKLKADPNVDISNSLMNDFPFMDRMIKETVRVCTYGILLRKAMAEYDLQNEFAIPSGAYLVVPFASIMKNPEIYANPLQFNPNRYDTEGKRSCEMLAFGGGKHYCPGAKFATMNIKTLVFNLLDRFDCEMTQKMEDLLPDPGQPMGVFRPKQKCLLRLVTRDMHSAGQEVK